MSVRLDDKACDEILTKNGKHVMIATDYVPFPFGTGYESQVFRVKRDGSVDHNNVLDERRYGEDEVAADYGHSELINKWIREVLV